MNAFGAGRTVYGSGSYAPTRGQVSAQGMQGYLRRETRRNNQGIYGGVSRFGGDGQSDTRSGMARQALARQQQNKWGGIEGRPGFNPNVKGGRGGKGGGSGPRPVANGGGANGTNAPVGAPVSTPSVVVNDDGTLELPYSPAWNEEILGGLQDTNSALLALQQQQQQQALQYASDKKGASDEYVTTKRDTLNDNASRGVAFSSGYGVAVGQDANNYNNLVNSLDLANSQANAGYDFDRTAIINAFKDQLRQGSLSYADSLVEGAGSLGYGGRGRGHRQSPTRKPKKKPGKRK